MVVLAIGSLVSFGHVSPSPVALGIVVWASRANVCCVRAAALLGHLCKSLLDVLKGADPMLFSVVEVDRVVWSFCTTACVVSGIVGVACRALVCSSSCSTAVPSCVVIWDV